MKPLKKLPLALTAVLCSVILFSCSKDDDKTSMTPGEILAGTAWETTNAKNNKGENVALTDANVVNFVGFAYFKSDGTFTIYNLDDSPKSQGDWSISADGKTRTIVAKNAAGQVLFTRVVDILTLTQQEFTYRVHPNSSDNTVYFDIVHTPTTHKEPK